MSSEGAERMLAAARSVRESLVAATKEFDERLRHVVTRRPSGRVREIGVNLIRAPLFGVRLGELCEITRAGHGTVGTAEVIGFADGLAILAPVDLGQPLSDYDEVTPLGRPALVETSADILGCVVDFRGSVISRASGKVTGQSRPRPLVSASPEPLSRKPITHVMETGVAAIDGLLTCGVGQRLGVFGAAGLGKSTLVRQLATAPQADVVVVGLVGERGREVGEFVASLDAVHMSRTVVVASTSDRPAAERANSALAALSIAEAFRDDGKSVLLILDSLTRVARAYREMALARGEPPSRRGFPPSVFSELPKLVERAGQGQAGSITSFFTVLAEGDVATDPIVEEVKSLVDGHIILSDDVAATGRYPAIDLLQSRSRLMHRLASESHSSAAEVIRARLAHYKRVELLIRVGEYQEGMDTQTDEAVATYARITRDLTQHPDEIRSFSETLDLLQDIACG